MYYLHHAKGADASPSRALALPINHPRQLEEISRLLKGFEQKTHAIEI